MYKYWAVGRRAGKNINIKQTQIANFSLIWENFNG